MTRKDYIVLADTLKQNGLKYLEPNTNIECYTLYKSICDDFVTALYNDNPNFDRDKFLTACGFTN